MKVKEAVALAKEHIGDLFADEDISHVGLEEVEFDEDRSMWKVTIGFSRPWQRPLNPLTEIVRQTPSNRSYKVVSIDDTTRHVKSVKNRETSSWAESA